MPLRGQTKRDVLTDFRRAELIEAASAVFAHKGFAAASVDDIARAAGVAKGTIYLYYPSKHDLYWAALESGIVVLHQAVRAAVAAVPLSLRDQLTAIARTKLTHFDQRRDFFRIFFSELGSQACVASTHTRLRPLHREHVEYLETLIAAAVARGEIPACEIGRVAFALTDLTRGVIRRRLLESTATILDDEVDFIVDLMWHGIAGRGAARGDQTTRARTTRAQIERAPTESAPTKRIQTKRIKTKRSERRPSPTPRQKTQSQKTQAQKTPSRQPHRARQPKERS